MHVFATGGTKDQRKDGKRRHYVDWLPAIRFSCQLLQNGRLQPGIHGN